MKRTMVIIVALAMLAACVQNTVTTSYPDGRVVVQEISDDGIYYQEAARALGVAEKSVCEKCTPGELIALRSYRAIEIISGKAFVDRGMNGYELTAKVSGDLVDVAPTLGLIGAVRYLSKRPSTIAFNGDGNAYVASDIMGSQNAVNIPAFSPPTTTTTITNPAQ